MGVVSSLHLDNGDGFKEEEGCEDKGKVERVEHVELDSGLRGDGVLQ